MDTHVKAIHSKILKNLNNVHLLQTIIRFFGYIVMDAEYDVTKEDNDNIKNCLDAMKTLEDEFQKALYEIAFHKKKYLWSYHYDKVVDEDNYKIVSCMEKDDEQGMYMYRRIIPVFTINPKKKIKGLALKYPCEPVLVHLRNPNNNQVLIQVTEHSAFLLAKKEEKVLFSYDNKNTYTAKEYLEKNKFICGFDQYVNHVVESNSLDEYKLIDKEFTYHELRFAHMYTKLSNLYNVHLQDRKTWDVADKQEKSINTIPDVLAYKFDSKDMLYEKYALFVDEIKGANTAIDPGVGKLRKEIIDMHMMTLVDMYNEGIKQEAVDWLTDEEYKYLEKYVSNKNYIYKNAKKWITGGDLSQEDLDHVKRTWSLINCTLCPLTIPITCCNCGPIPGFNALFKFTGIVPSTKGITSALRIARVCLILNSCLSAYRFWEYDGMQKFKAAGKATLTTGVNEFAYHTELFRIIQIIRFAHSILPTTMQYQQQVNRQVNDAFTYMIQKVPEIPKEGLTVLLAHIYTYWYRTVTEEWGFFPNYEPVNSTSLALTTAHDFFTERINSTYSYAIIENGWLQETDKIIGQGEAVVRNMLFLDLNNKSYSMNNTYMQSIFNFIETISPMVQPQGWAASMETHATGLDIAYQMYMNLGFITSFLSLSLLLTYAQTAGRIGMLMAPRAAGTVVNYKAAKEVGYYVFTNGRYVWNLIGIYSARLQVGRARLEQTRSHQLNPEIYRSFENRKGASPGSVGSLANVLLLKN
jgi:hypothetical protein